MEKTLFTSYRNKMRTEFQSVYALCSPIQPKIGIKKLNNSFEDFRLESTDGKSNRTLTQKYQAFTIGICGGANSGKSFILKDMRDNMKKIGVSCVYLKEKNFFKPLDRKFETDEERIKYIEDHDFDSPDAIDWSLFEKALNSLINKKPFDTPIYDLTSERRLNMTRKLMPSD